MSDLPPSTPASSGEPTEHPTPPPSAAAEGPSTQPAPIGVRVARPKANNLPRPVRRTPIPTYTESKRDTVIALLCGMGVLAFIVVGFYVLQGVKTQPVGNKLTGVIVEKYATGVAEKEISLGKKGLASEETDTGFYFRVKVPSEPDRIFELSVNEGVYEAAKVGDQQDFIRPRSEQK